MKKLYSRLQNLLFLLIVVSTGKLKVDGGTHNIFIPRANRLELVALKRFRRLLTKEPDTTQWIEKIAEISNKNDQKLVFFDIGSNVGTVSYLLCLNSNISPHLILCETNPSNLGLSFNIIKANFKTITASFLCGFLKSEQTIEAIPTQFMGEAGKTIGDSAERENNKTPQIVYNAPISNEVIAQILSVNQESLKFLKIDVDGAELSVIQGLEKKILSQFSNALVETDIDNKAELEEILLAFAECNLHPTAISQYFIDYFSGKKRKLLDNNFSQADQKIYNHQMKRLEAFEKRKKSHPEIKLPMTMNVIFEKRQ